MYNNRFVMIYETSFLLLSSQILTIIERDDGNKKKQTMEKGTKLPCV